MPVIFIPERNGSKNNSRERADKGCFVAKLIFLVFLALADALYFRFVKRVYLIRTVTFLRKNFIEEFKHLFITSLIWKIAVRFSDQTTGYRSQTSVCLDCLLVILGVIAKTLIRGNLFQSSSVTLT